MLMISFFVLFVIGTVYGSPAANMFVDTVIRRTLPEELKNMKLAPASLPNFSAEFQDKIPIIGKVKVKANYKDGIFSGLQEVTRFGECVGPLYSFGHRSINCTISFENLATSFQGKVKYGKVPKVTVCAKSSISKTLLSVHFGVKPTSEKTEVLGFKYQQMGQMKIKFTGLGPLSKKLKFLEDGYRKHVWEAVYNLFAQQYIVALNYAASKVEMPQ